MTKKATKKKETERAFIAISVPAHAVIKEFTERKGYNIGKFVEIAALEKIENETQKDKK